MDPARLNVGDATAGGVEWLVSTGYPAGQVRYDEIRETPASGDACGPGVAAGILIHHGPPPERESGVRRSPAGRNRELTSRPRMAMSADDAYGRPCEIRFLAL